MNGPRDEHRPGAGLSAPDQAALDALIESGFDLDAVAPEHRERAEAVGRLMGLLETDDATGASRGLTDRTMQRIDGERGADMAGPAALSEGDRRAIDHLAAAGWDADRVPEAHRSRARHAARLLGELRVEGVTTNQTADLADRTMDLIRVHAQREADREAQRRLAMDAAADLGPGRRGFRLADLGAVAAMVLIGVAVFWPVLGGLRSSAERALCAQNMHNAAVGFGLHTSDQAGRLPMHSASLLRVAPGRATWWDVGTPERSHSANLFQLVEGDYATVHDLACPGNSLAPVVRWGDSSDWRSIDEVSYSYQLFGGRRGVRMSDLAPGDVLLTDKSPVVDRARRGEHVYAEERSHNHGGAGQHVMFANGSVKWLVRPVTERGDNLWLPADLSDADGVRLYGSELPSSPGDAFVGP